MTRTSDQPPNRPGARPRGGAESNCFRLERLPIGAPRAGEYSLRTLWLSLDPYMRGRMSDAPSYVAPVPIGGVMSAGSVARVEKSLSSGLQEREISCCRERLAGLRGLGRPGLHKLPAGHADRIPRMAGAPRHARLYRLRRLARITASPGPDETVAVAAATGAVGSLVGPDREDPWLPRRRHRGRGRRNALGPCRNWASMPASITAAGSGLGSRRSLSRRHRRLFRERRRQGVRRRPAADERPFAHSRVRIDLACTMNRQA